MEQDHRESVMNAIDDGHDARGPDLVSQASPKSIHDFIRLTGGARGNPGFFI